MPVSRRGKKLRLVAAIVCILAAAFAFAWMSALRRTIIYRTDFTAEEEGRLKRVVGAWCPEGARVDWAMSYHSRDTNYYIRMQVPTDAARKFRERVGAAGTAIADYDPRWLAENSDAPPPKIDAAFAVDGDVDFIIFGKSNDEMASVFFEVMGFPERKDLAIDDVFIPRR